MAPTGGGSKAGATLREASTRGDVHMVDVVLKASPLIINDIDEVSDANFSMSHLVYFRLYSEARRC
jgi:hypothetical protein